MRTIGAAFILAGVLALALGATSRARAGTWGLGADAAFSRSSTDLASDNLTSFGWPSSWSYFQPGLRLSRRSGSGRGEFFLNAGYLSLGDVGALSANGQINFGRGWKWGPFLNAGAGFGGHGSRDEFSTERPRSGIFAGVGVGVRRWIADGYGSFRIEARIDSWAVSRSSSNSEMSFHSVEVIGLKLGYDIWLK